MRTALWIAWLLVACTDGPTSTDTPCADPDPITGTTTLTWDNFGQAFMATYCTNCHNSTLGLNERNGAPLFHDFDSLEGTVEPKVHIDQQAGWGPDAHNDFMPGTGTNGRCPSTVGGALDEACPMPTSEERTNLAIWLACEVKRPHCYDSTGNDPPGGCGSGG